MTEEHSFKMTLNLAGDRQRHPVPASALIKHVPEGETPPRLEHSPALVISQSRNVGNKTLGLRAASRSWRRRNPIYLPVQLLMKRCSELQPWAQSWVWSYSESPLATQARSSWDAGVGWLCSCATGGSWSPAQGTLAEVAQGRVSHSSPAAASFSCSSCRSRGWEFAQG